MTIMLREIMKFDNKTTEDVFRKCRKPNSMRLTEFENFVRDTVKA